MDGYDRSAGVAAHGFLLEDVFDGEEQILGSFLNFGHQDLPLIVFFFVDGEVGFEVSLVVEGYDFGVLEPGVVNLNIVFLVVCAFRVAHLLTNFYFNYSSCEIFQ